jgi:hypothetical protein
MAAPCCGHVSHDAIADAIAVRRADVDERRIDLKVKPTPLEPALRFFSISQKSNESGHGLFARRRPRRQGGETAGQGKRTRKIGRERQRLDFGELQ